MKGFPDAAFLGVLCIYSASVKKINQNPLRYWRKHRNLFGGCCWNLPKKAGQSQIVVHWLWPSPNFEVIAVDADSVNLAYIRKSLEKNALWGNAAVRLINNAVRFVKSWKPFLPAFLSISFRFLAITYLHKNQQAWILSGEPGYVCKSHCGKCKLLHRIRENRILWLLLF